MNNLIKRTITGAVFVGVVIFSILFNQYAFLGVFALVVAGSLVEFYNIIKRDDVMPQKIWGTIVGVLLFASLFFVANGLMEVRCLACFIPLIISIFIIELYKNKANPLHNIGYTLFGIIYIVLPFGLMPFVLCDSSHDFAYNSKLLMSIFIMVWANDTFAYLSGMMLGRHKLFERISPKKTWEGSIGGAIATMLIGFFVFSSMFDFCAIHWFIIAALVSVFGTYGDLAESHMKRTLGIKDSGSVLPGHGGFLDRFDAVIFAFPTFFAYLSFI